MDKFIVVFCEGDHDIAFLRRLLLVEGFSDYNNKLKDFIKPLNALYSTHLPQTKIENIEFKYYQPYKKVPYAVLSQNNTLVIFHNLSGDGNILNGNSSKIVKMYLDLNAENRRKIDKYDELSYRFLYFLDADNEGVVCRVNELKKILDFNELEHHKIHSKDNYELGCYIFHDSLNKNKEGKLEDVLLSLMQPDNEEIFQKSSEYVSSSQLEDQRRKEFNCNEEQYRGSIQFKEQKSIISVAGQLQFSGSNNTVIIAKSDYIKKSDMKNNPVCQDILELFKYHSIL